MYDGCNIQMSTFETPTQAGNKLGGGGQGPGAIYTVNYVKFCKFLEKRRKFP